MKLKYISTLLLGLFLVAGCNQENDIIPTEEDELSFVLPQGDHDYDEDLLRYHEKYGFLPVYIFSERDLYWNNTEWAGGDLDYSQNQGILLGKSGNPDYVGKQWELCKDVFFDCYPDSTINLMPLKFFLCSELKARIYNGKAEADENGWFIYHYDTTRLMAYQGFDYIAVNFGSPAIDTISRLTKMNFSRELNAIFLTYLHENKKPFHMPKEFSEVSNYTYRSLSGEAVFQNGFIKTSILDYLDKTGATSKANDFKSFLSFVTIPLEILEGEPATFINYWSVPMEGALNPKRDVSGLIRKKYNIMIKFLKEECGINTDLLQYPSFK